jgi:hypothetical protein
VHLAVGALGQLLAVLVTPASEQARAQVDELAGKVANAATAKRGYAGAVRQCLPGTSPLVQ